MRCKRSEQARSLAGGGVLAVQKECAKGPFTLLTGLFLQAPDATTGPRHEQSTEINTNRAAERIGTRNPNEKSCGEEHAGHAPSASQGTRCGNQTANETAIKKQPVGWLRLSEQLIA